MVAVVGYQSVDRPIPQIVKESTRGQKLDWASKKLLALGQKAAENAMRARCSVEWHNPQEQPDGEPWKYQKPTRKKEKNARVKAGFKAAGYSLIGLVPAIFGVASRALARVVRGKANYRLDNSTLRDRAAPFSLATFNVAGLMPAATLRNGLKSFEVRLRPIFNAIVRQNAEIVVLQEAFDAVLVKKLIKRLKQQGYTNYVYNVDTNGFGVSSGLALMSKMPIEHFEFKRYPRKIRGGFGKWTHKGCLKVEVVFSKGVRGSIYVAHKNGGAKAPDHSPLGGGYYRIRQTRLIQDWISQDPRELKMSVQDTNCSTLKPEDQAEWSQERPMIEENFPLYAPWNPPDPEGTSSSYDTTVGMVGWDLEKAEEWFNRYRKPNNNLDRLVMTENCHYRLNPNWEMPDINPGEGGSDHCMRTFHFVPMDGES